MQGNVIVHTLINDHFVYLFTEVILPISVTCVIALVRIYPKINVYKNSHTKMGWDGRNG